ncbi:ATP-binding protein [Streptomyces clavifer]|uniref:ATP-binding protein n=1 Tax=Streptomyces clavifer TaxID=68188 RepID=UPI0033220F27
MNGEQEVPRDGERSVRGPEEAVGPPAWTAPPGTTHAPGVPRNAAAARDIVSRLLEEEFCGLGGEAPADVVVADALLVTSELVTNAVRHGGGLMAFSATITDDGLLLTVGDASTRAPVTAEHTTTLHIGGYGWELVRRLAARVSVTYHEDGKNIVALVALV